MNVGKTEFVYATGSKKKTSLQESNKNTKDVLAIEIWTIKYICWDNRDKSIEVLTSYDIYITVELSTPMYKPHAVNLRPVWKLYFLNSLKFNTT